MDISVLQTHPVLKELSASEHERLRPLCTLLNLQQGHLLLAEGSENHQLFFLIEGELTVCLSSKDTRHSLTLAPGEVVGDMSVFEEKPAAASVLAATACVVLAMPAEVFWNDFCASLNGVRSLLKNLVLRMRRTNVRLQEAFEQKLRLDLLQRELESAARVQQNLLPPPSSLNGVPGWEITTLFKPARSVGGDFYDVIPVDAQRTAVVIGDVSGKGMPAALFMVRVVTALRVLFAQKTAPDYLLAVLNQQLCLENEELMFVTLAIVLIDRELGNVSYLNGGHNPLLFVPKGQGAAVWESPKGTLLGAIPEGKFATSQRPMAPGDSVILYTDGIPEAENADRHHFGLENAQRVLGHAPETVSDGPDLSKLASALEAFVGATPQSDDITAVCVRRVR